jgi:hypothetical protein
MDLPVTFIDIRDDTTVLLGGEFARWKKYTFYLGKFGPFVERVALEGFTEYEITRRVDALRAHLVQIHT